MYATTAKREYGLNDADLSSLQCKVVPNPHTPRYSSRLYNKEEVIALAAHKNSPEYRATEEARIAAAKAAKVAQKAAAKAAAKASRGKQCSEAAAALQAPIFECPPRPHQKQVLPTVLWVEILAYLADDLEPDGLRSASVVAREMVRFCSLSKELYEALPGALSRLGALLLLTGTGRRSLATVHAPHASSSC
jgi:hypothetical protein